MRHLPPIRLLFALLLLQLGAPQDMARAQAGFEAPQKATVVGHLGETTFAPGAAVKIEILVEVEKGWHVNSSQPTYDYLIPTSAEVTLPPGWAEARLTYPEGEFDTFAFADEPLSVYDGQFIIEAETTVPVAAAAGTASVALSVRYQACDDRSCLPPATAEAELTLEVSPDAEGAVGVAAGPSLSGGVRSEAGGQADGGGLFLFLLFGLIGGLLLNAMPCVLPVLSLKLLGLVKSAAQDRRAVVSGSLATASGILFSFWALALAAIGAKSVGAAVGWGIQFQQPVFVTALVFIVTLFCLNLWGLFEVPLPRRVAGWAEAAGGEGLPAHFTAGLFATLMATPCSAPFLGTAVGFALAQTSGVIFAVFSAVGVGMALPYFFLAAAPGAIKLLPKPGIWMEHFRRFMGFLLAAAAVWLLYVLASQVSGERLAFIEITILCLALFVWMRHSAKQNGVWRWLGIGGAAAAIALGLWLAGTGSEAADSQEVSSPVRKLIPWVAFDRAEAQRLAATGKPVFVDVTADWCFTCKVNERLVLETPEIAAAFAAHSVVPMKADWTNRDDEIARFLADHGKYGIPFYLLYRPGLEPLLLSELLTKEALLEALESPDAVAAPTEPDSVPPA